MGETPEYFLALCKPLVGGVDLARKDLSDRCLEKVTISTVYFQGERQAYYKTACRAHERAVHLLVGEALILSVKGEGEHKAVLQNRMQRIAYTNPSYVCDRALEVLDGEALVIAVETRKV